MMKFSDDRSDFVDLSEVIADLIIDIRYYSDYNFVGTRIAGYEQPVALLTRKAAEAAQAAVSRIGDPLQGFDPRVEISKR